MKKFLLLFVTFVFLFTFAGLGIAGGTKKPEAPEEEAEAPKAIEEAPSAAPGPIRRGGVLVVSTRGGPVKTLDPHKVVGDESYLATFHIFSALTHINKELGADPELAESWEKSPDAKTWTFYLRKNAYFHNGRQVTAEDVKFSMDRVLDKNQSPRGYNKIGPIKEVRVKDKFTVVFELSKPYLDLPIDLGGVFPKIVAKENISEINTNPIGSGPFKLKKWDPGGVCTLERSDNYYIMGEDGKPLPYVDEYRIVPIGEPLANLAALKSGDIHIVYQIAYDIIEQATLEPEIVVMGSPTQGYHPIVLNLEPEIESGIDPAEARVFQNKKVRQAFSYIIDRKAALQLAIGGHGILANDQPIPPFHIYGNKSEKPKEQNIELAKKLLAEAGIKPGTHFTCYTSPGRAGMMELAIAFREMAKKADIVIDIEVVDISRYWSDIEFKVPMMTSNWGGRQTINAGIKPYYYTGGGANESHYSDPELDKILDAAEEETDFQKRKELYNKAQAMVSDASVTIIPYFKNYYFALRREVMGVEAHPLTYLWVDRAWLAKK